VLLVTIDSLSKTTSTMVRFAQVEVNPVGERLSNLSFSGEF